MSDLRPAPKTFAVKTFGCQMNVYDGERMAELLAAQGMMVARRTVAKYRELLQIPAAAMRKTI